MAFLPFSVILDLRRELHGSDAEILTWGCDGYGDSIKQWSDSCDTQVVSNALSVKFFLVPMLNFIGCRGPSNIGR
jgi:hypothetical protein